MRESPLFDALATDVHRIRERLKQACIREVSEWTGLVPTTLYNIRAGRNMTLRNLELLAVYFDAEHLLKDPEKARAQLPAYPWAASLVSVRGESDKPEIKLTRRPPARDPSIPIAPWESEQ